MDNVTHSLVGALLGQMGLKRRTGLAMPTLIIAANLPDIDASCTVLGMVSLAMRRGVTHGPIAMLLLPLALTGIMIAYDRRQVRRGTRPAERLPVRPGWLLGLAYIGCLSHPFFDWLNSYGVRLLEPFSHRWFYGDALFIVDPWLLAMLIAGVWLSWRRERRGHARWTAPARVMIVSCIAYVVTNLLITASAVEKVRRVRPDAVMVVANPVPVVFWWRDVLWRSRTSFGSFFVSSSGAWLEGGHHYNYMDDSRIARRAKGNAAARAFLFWSRMPVAEVRGDTIILRDQRFLGMPTASQFAVELKP